MSHEGDVRRAVHKEFRRRGFRRFLVRVGLVLGLILGGLVGAAVPTQSTYTDALHRQAQVEQYAADAILDKYTSILSYLEGGRRRPSCATRKLTRGSRSSTRSTGTSRPGSTEKQRLSRKECGAYLSASPSTPCSPCGRGSRVSASPTSCIPRSTSRLAQVRSSAAWSAGASPPLSRTGDARRARSLSGKCCEPRCERRGARCKAPRRRRCASIAQERQRSRWPRAAATRRAQGGCGRIRCRSSSPMEEHRLPPRSLSAPRKPPARGRTPFPRQAPRPVLCTSSPA